MDMDDLKRRLQDHFGDGLVTIVGTGLSIAEGIPGMPKLGLHLMAEVPTRVVQPQAKEWKKIEVLLQAGIGLESALLKRPPSSALEEVIVDLTASFLLNAEKAVIENVIGGGQKLPFARLLRHMLKPKMGIPVITTNYDRLLEVAIEMAGLGVDSLFVGEHIARLDPTMSKMRFVRKVRLRKRTHVVKQYAERVVLLKPHGSLDWYMMDGEPIKCPLPASLPRLMITPGLNKYKSGYERPFDAHRERANAEIDRGARYLFLGYGFNDYHLQTHLVAQLAKGKAGLILTRSLTKAAEATAKNNENVIAIAEGTDDGKKGSWILNKGSIQFIAGKAYWDLGTFIDEVLEP